MDMFSKNNILATKAILMERSDCIEGGDMPRGWDVPSVMGLGRNCGSCQDATAAKLKITSFAPTPRKGD